MTKHLRALFDVRRGEVLTTLLMSSYFFLVITSFWILKPIKKSLFLRFYKDESVEILGFVLRNARAEQLAKMLNMVVAVVAASLFVHLSARFRRERLTYVLCAAMLIAFFMFTRALAAPTEWTVWSFYLFGDLFNMLMVACFFAFQNDIASPDLARRTYGVVVLGGVLGGVFGSTFLKMHIRDFAAPTWMWVCFGLTAATSLFAAVVARFCPQVQEAALLTEAPVLSRFDTQAGVAGARLVARSPYLISIVALVALYELVSAMLDFQFSATTAHFLSASEIDDHFATVFMITNWASLGVQLLATSWVMRRLGVAAALSVLPLSVLAVSSGFVLLPGLWVGSFLSIADNALNYSLNQSAKESLYVPTSQREKYQAKAFIDVFVQRTAKVVGLVLILVLDGMMANDFSFVRLMSVFVVALAAVWLWHARSAGGRFDAVSGSPAE